MYSPTSRPTIHIAETMPQSAPRRVLILAVVLVAALVGLGGMIWGDDILRAALDPQEPFQIYRPPPPPDYAKATAWAIRPGAAPDGNAADIFFISPTTFDGGRHWNAPIDNAQADRWFRRVVAPNYVGPFQRAGRLYAPRYRQASLYTLTTLREDAREARKFAYGDVAAAFAYYLAHDNQGRPFVIVGVEQGGTLAARLLAEQVTTRPEIRRQLAAAYMIEAVTPANSPPIAPCQTRSEAGCLAAWASAFDTDLAAVQDIHNRSLVWAQGGDLENLKGRKPLCFNPILGATTDQSAPARLALGAANATGLEWGVRPPFLSRVVSATCQDGVLKVGQPKSGMLRPTGSWADRQKVPAYNLFYADLEADAKARIAAWGARTTPQS